MESTSQDFGSYPRDFNSREEQARMRVRRARATEQAIERARKRRLRRRVRITALVAVALLVCGVAGAKLAPSILSGNLPFAQANTALPATKAAKTPVISKSFSASKLKSSHAILIDGKSGKTLFSKGDDEKVYPASLTKIMSAVIVIENAKDLRDEVTLDSAIFDEARKQNASVAGFMPGERVKVEDLLYGMMLPSGADCTLGLANYVAGSEDRFVDLMNRKAKKLGMTGTHFTNASGLHGEDHYTTPLDMAKLMRYALKNEEFRKVVSASKHTIRSTNLHPSGVTLFSTLFEELPDPAIKDGAILGGKTGYTSEAGLCLASFAKKHGKEYILITTGAPGDHKSKPRHVIDAQKVYNDLLL